jgi:RNA polymerase subunit RPABC4/transcription elongation factor Spt4
MTSNRDLRKLQGDEIQDAFSKLVSGGKQGYKSILEKKEPIFCSSCKTQIEGHEKFCPKCGSKIEKFSNVPKLCEKCYNLIPKGNKFCTECGTPSN